MPENPLINVGELTKPATVLIERISDGIGLVYAPRHVRRMAAAEADAARIATLAQIECSDIERRALERRTREEGRHQYNMESIATEALGYVNSDARPEDIEDDWITSFFVKCRNISSKEMQSLWARVLAGEANKPGSFSPRTLEFLPDISKHDASAFTALCSFYWHYAEVDIPILLAFNTEASIYKEKELNFGTLDHLDSIGLISFRPEAGLSIRVPKKFTISYFGRPVEVQRMTKTFYVGECKFTKVGEELAPISGAQPSERYFQLAFKRLARGRYRLLSRYIGRFGRLKREWGDRS